MLDRCRVEVRAERGGGGGWGGGEQGKTDRETDRDRQKQTERKREKERERETHLGAAAAENARYLSIQLSLRGDDSLLASASSLGKWLARKSGSENIKLVGKG